MGYLIMAATAAPVVWAVVAYNRLVRDRNRVRTAWSDIDVQLKRRYDLVPKLVAAVKQYARYERSTLEALITLRRQAVETDRPDRKGPLEGLLGNRLNRLIALAEDYPELKADRGFLRLQRDLTEVENHIQYARRYYNGAVRDLNTRIDSFPDLLLARVFGFSHEPFFELASPDESRSPEVELT